MKILKILLQKIVKFYKSRKDLYVTRLKWEYRTYCDDVSNAIILS